MRRFSRLDAGLSLKLNEKMRRCYSCREPVHEGISGHQFQNPICTPCFRELDEEGALAGALDQLEAASKCHNCYARPSLKQAVDELLAVGTVKVHPGPLSCATCKKVIPPPYAGAFQGTAYCNSCFSDVSPSIAPLLMLYRAAEVVLDQDRSAAELLRIAAVIVQAARRR